jgi:transcriptional regulator with XRE-family HTH domain
MAKKRRRWFLKEWRTAGRVGKLSQEQLGAKVGLTQGMISHLETGETDYTGSHLEDLSKALKCTIYELLFVDPTHGQSAMAVYEDLPESERQTALDLLLALRKRASG